ncbi:MAG TPA: DNA mismatch repair endonuclease MutL [Oscillospiraceae bacterium]|nr:DNA mismatch repair endonuclease MutL [Oscillospiraceae bacterium]
MNKKIEMLDNLTINKIAAGEMIEAPHSVVKELVENSIDANASMITLEIKEGGKKYIRVTDNGVGISEEYVEQAFMRHSTSKITGVDDLNSIASLGFRGEALASIAAVSQVEMITRTANQAHGMMIEVTGGKIETVKKVGCPVGTTVIVKNLFFNTPARLKFMKSNSAETMKISKTITLLSLSNPGIIFKYINNNEIIFTTPGDNVLSQTILSVLDKDTFKNLIFLEEESDMKLWGYISQPNFVRGNRNLQIIYVNGRYIKNKLISKAIEDAYKEKVIINRYPVCILNLNIDPSETDINVHPSKTEIKFEKGEQVQEFIYKAIAETLEKDSVIPKLQVTEDKYQEEQISDLIPISPAEIGNPEEIMEDMDATGDVLINEIDENYTKQSSFLDALSSQYKIIGQIFNTYIILEKEQSIYLIDQHAAHERLLYNRFLKEIEDENIVSQKLVEAKVLELSNEDYILLSDNMDLFIKLGFHMEDFGINAVIIREVPMILGKPQDFSFIYEILDEMRNDDKITGHFEDTIVKRACKKAIKAKDKLDHHEIKQLVEELHTLVPPLTCPHGRPIILTMGQYDIEKHFKRIQ